MKASIISFAVLALLGHTNAITLKNSAKQQEKALVEDENRPDDTILLQTSATIHHHRHSHKQGHLSMAQKAKGKGWSWEQNLDKTEGPWYSKVKEGTNWFELDRVDERIHGSPRFEATDDVSPHDPDVVDAPEDIKRVGNDHEELHNAKLSPDGYYKGFFHKDYKGNYAQVKSEHHHHKHNKRDQQMLQIEDHDNDTDDIPYSYEADGIKAVPREGQSDYDLIQTGSQITIGDNEQNKAQWGAYLQHQANIVLTDQKKINDEMEKVYAQEEDEGSYEFVQLRSHFNHDDDTQDIAEDQDPIELRKNGKSGEYVPDRQQLLADKMEEKKENDAAEVQEYIQQQSEEDSKSLAEQTKRDNEKRQQEIEAEKTQKEREENKDVNEQIDKFVKH